MDAKHLLFFVVLITGFRVWAADGGAVTVTSNSAQPTAPPPVLKRAGDRYVLDLQDGRVATLFQATGPVGHLGVPLKQIENTCDYSQVPSSCKLQLEYADYAVYFKWSKHPDPQKIGHIVKYKSLNVDPPQTGDLEDNRQILLWYTSLRQPEWKGLLKPDRLVCDNLNWTKLIPKNGQRLTVQSWTSEANNQNKETNANENQTFLGVFNTEMIQIDDKTLQFDKFGADSSPTATIPPYFGLQTSNANFQAADGRVCQVSFQVDTQGLGALNDQKPKIDPATERPLIVNTIFSNSQIFYQILQIVTPGMSDNWSFQ